MELNCEPTGEFAHNPGTLPQNLTEISEVIVREKADLGIVVDPDVDRLAFVSEDGSMFVEEYTLVAVADYILSEKPGNTVSNLSSSRALRDVTERHGGKYYASAVGEVNVVAKMKEVGAVIGGEGNGGVIYPELHYGRDALVGTALFLTWLAKKGMTMTRLRATYPSYYASKNKIELTPVIDVDKVLREVKERYAGENVNDIDGVKIDFAENWVHLRKSNTGGTRHPRLHRGGRWTRPTRWRSGSLPKSRRSATFKTMKESLLILAAAAMVSCGGNAQQKAATAGTQQTTAAAPDMHNAETSLDYLGVYEGTLPAADCPGIETTLTLAPDGSYALHLKYIDRDTEFDEKGAFTVKRNQS